MCKGLFRHGIIANYTVSSGYGSTNYRFNDLPLFWIQLCRRSAFQNLLFWYVKFQKVSIVAYIGFTKMFGKWTDMNVRYWSPIISKCTVAFVETLILMAQWGLQDIWRTVSCLCIHFTCLKYLEWYVIPLQRFYYWEKWYHDCPACCLKPHGWLGLALLVYHCR